jgi:hypothetical protein
MRVIFARGGGGWISLWISLLARAVLVPRSPDAGA